MQAPIFGVFFLFLKEGIKIAVDFLQKAIGNSASTTASSSISNSDTALPLTSDTNFQADSGKGMVIIDEGQATEELAYSTGLSGSSLTIPLANRGLEGGAAAAHDSGASVKGILTAGMWNNVVTALLNLVSVTTGALDTTKVVDLTTAQSLKLKVVSPKTVGIQVVDAAISTSTGDAKAFFRVPAALNGFNLTGVAASVYTAGTTGTTDVQIRNKTQTADMLSTKITIDSGETDTSTAATAAVIDTANDDVATGDVLAIDVDAVSSTPSKGLYVELTFSLP